MVGVGGWQRVNQWPLGGVKGMAVIVMVSDIVNFY